MRTGPPYKADPEQCFLWWYNNGERRTLVDTAKEFDISTATAQNYARANDWDGRAQELDTETIRQLLRNLPVIAAKQRMGEIQILRATLTKFARRFREGSEFPITDGDIGYREFYEMIKAAELLFGGATERVDLSVGDTGKSLEQIEAEIAKLDLASQDEIDFEFENSVTDKDLRMLGEGDD